MSPLFRQPFIHGKPPAIARAEQVINDSGDNLSVYKRNVFRTPKTNITNFRDQNQYQQYSLAGDHLYIASISGGGTIQVKLSKASNPWIDVDEGMTLIREFDIVWVRDAQEYANNLGFFQSECIFYSSFGPLFDRPYKMGGLRAGFITWNGVATTAPLAFHNMTNAQYVRTPTTDIIAYNIYVQNVDAANKVTIDYAADNGAAIPANTGFDISPGVILPLELDGPITFLSDQILGSPDVKMGLRFGTRAGTCAYQVMYNIRSNATNAAMEATRSIQPLQIET